MNSKTYFVQIIFWMKTDYNHAYFNSQAQRKARFKGSGWPFQYIYTLSNTHELFSLVPAGADRHQLVMIRESSQQTNRPEFLLDEGGVRRRKSVTLLGQYGIDSGDSAGSVMHVSVCLLKAPWIIDWGFLLCWNDDRGMVLGLAVSSWKDWYVVSQTGFGDLTLAHHTLIKILSNSRFPCRCPWS